MKDWLDNVSDGQIRAFAKERYDMYDNIKITRTTKDGKDIVVFICEKNASEDVVFDKYYYNSFGEYNLNESCGLVLKPFDDYTELWFDMVFKSNKNESINGLTYLEAFEQSHEKSIAKTGSIKHAEINKRIAELNAIIKKNNLYINLELTRLHQFTNARRRETQTIEHGLIVKDFLRKMNVRERRLWLERNGLISTNTPEKIELENTRDNHIK